MDKTIPREYSENLVKVNIDGVEAKAWKLNDLIIFLKSPDSQPFVILGGDVLSIKKNNEMSYTYDNWAIKDREPGQSFSSYADMSKQTAIDYLKQYPTKDSNLFILTLTSEATAGL